jgi:myo-inositol-1(or 4)-monophosphatase
MRIRPFGPLDGTLNFSREIPVCCVSIALWQGAKPLFGVIYDFKRDECYQAVAGEQSLCNGEPIRVSDIRDRSQASIGTGFPSYRDYSSESLQEFLGQVQQFKKVRMLGSAAMHMAYLARGWLDAYVEEDIMLWDVAAGMAVIEGAGGVVELTRSPNYKWGRIIRCASHEDIWA